MTLSTNKRISLFPILLVNFIGTLGFSIVLPFLVILINRLGGNALVYGVMGATYSAFQLVGAPVLGRWSDVYGRRVILLVSQLGTLLSWMVFLAALFIEPHPLFSVRSGWLGSFVVSAPLLLIFAARALDGLTGGNVSVANAYLADIVDDRDRKTYFGKMAVAGNLGFILGPAIAGLLGATRFGEVAPVVAALAISVVASLVIALYLPESNPCVLRERPDASGVHRVFGQEPRDCFRLDGAQTRPRGMLELPGITHLLVVYFIIFLAFNLFYTAFPVNAVSSLEWSIGQVGLFFSFLGLTTVVVQGPVLSRLGQRVSDRTLVLLGAFVLGTGFVVLTSSNTLILYLGAALFALGNGLMWPSFLAMLSNTAGDRYQGAVQGLGSSAGSFASIVGLVAGGLLFENIGGKTFLLSSALIFLVLVLCFFAPTLRGPSPSLDDGVGADAPAAP